MTHIKQVMSVYSGRPGCMCGCRGKHSYAAQFVAQASKDRGYPVTPDDVNDRMVTRVTKMMDMQNGMFPVCHDDDNDYVRVGNRDYVVYFA